MTIACPALWLQAMTTMKGAIPLPITQPAPTALVERPADAPAGAAATAGDGDLDDDCATCPKCVLVTPAMLKQIFPEAPANRLKIVADGVNININDGKLDSEKRLTHFFGQVRQETGPGMRFRESLNYSADGLMKSAFSYYKGNAARSKRDARNEEAIANNAYDDANRGEGFKMGNTKPGDGWRYRGRGLKQLTGRYNYGEFSKTHKEIWGEDIDFVANPDKVDEPVYAVRSAMGFWVKHKLYLTADTGITRRATDSITAVVNKKTDSYAKRWGFVQDIWRDRIFKDVCFNTTRPLRNADAAKPFGTGNTK